MSAETTPTDVVFRCTAEDGCEGPTRRYIVTHPDGKKSLVEYCAACAELAAVNWNGNVKAIEEAQ